MHRLFSVSKLLCGLWAARTRIQTHLARRGRAPSLRRTLERIWPLKGAPRYPTNVIPSGFSAEEFLYRPSLNSLSSLISPGSENNGSARDQMRTFNRSDCSVLQHRYVHHHRIDLICVVQRLCMSKIFNNAPRRKVPRLYALRTLLNLSFKLWTKLNLHNGWWLGNLRFILSVSWFCILYCTVLNNLRIWSMLLYINLVKS